MFFSNIRLYKEFSACCFTQHQFNMFHCVILDVFSFPLDYFVMFFTLNTEHGYNLFLSDLVYLFHGN